MMLASLMPARWALLLVVGGCSIVPNTRDVTHLPTYEIAHRVRCEARLALRDNLVQWLETTKEPEKLALAQIVKIGTPEQIKQALYNSSARPVIDIFSDTGIS